MTVVELKALAYDESLKLTQAQQNINIINQRLQQLSMERENGKLAKPTEKSGR